MRTGECNRCGKCCSYIKLPLERTLTEDETRWAEMHRGITIVDRYVRLEAPCAHFVDSACAIYEQRPQMCRDYPQIPGLDEGCSYVFKGDGGAVNPR